MDFAQFDRMLNRATYMALGAALVLAFSSDACAHSGHGASAAHSHADLLVFAIGAAIGAIAYLRK